MRQVIADYTANPAFVAADLLSQAEHGVDSQVVLVAVSLTAEKLQAIENEVDVQAHALSRVDIVRESVAKSIIVKTSSVADAINFSNDYAPEHLILHLENASSHVASIDNAGSVFVGPFTPERSVNLCSWSTFVSHSSFIAVAITPPELTTHYPPTGMLVSLAA